MQEYIGLPDRGVTATPSCLQVGTCQRAGTGHLIARVKACCDAKRSELS